MPNDPEFFTCNSFNEKIKNYLRDLYVYQFKSLGKDLKTKKTVTIKKVEDEIVTDAKTVKKSTPMEVVYPNELIKPSIYDQDIGRLMYTIAELAGVEWRKIDKRKNKNGSLDINQECLTIDTVDLKFNPFHELYYCCAENSIKKNYGSDFIVLSLIMFLFNGGKSIDLNVDPEIETIMQKYLEESALKIFVGKSRRNQGIVIETGKIPEDKLEKFSNIAIEELMQSFNKKNNEEEDTNQQTKKLIYEYIFVNNLRIVYTNRQFCFEKNLNSTKILESNNLIRLLYHFSVKEGIELKGIGYNEKQLKNKLDALTNSGILVRSKNNNLEYYSLGNLFINDLTKDLNENAIGRFYAMIYFFSQTAALGEIGTYILKRYFGNGYYDQKFPICFKHNYIKRSLNDYNLGDLLYAIKNNKYIYMEYRNASADDLAYQQIICFPLELRENVNDGKQYLIYYYPEFRSVSSIIIDNIDRIVTIKKEKMPQEEKKRAKFLIEHTWGLSFGNFQKGNVKETPVLKKVHMIIQIKTGEKYVVERIIRELPCDCEINRIDDLKYGKCIDLKLLIVNPYNMISWLRSYISRIIRIEIDGKDFEKIEQQVDRLYNLYFSPDAELVLSKNNKSNKNKSLLMDQISIEEKEDESIIHYMLYNELFSKVYFELGSFLYDITANHQVNKKWLNKYKFSYDAKFRIEGDAIERRNLQFDRCSNTFLSPDKTGNEYHSIFTLSDPSKIKSFYDLIPLTKIEKQWLINILDNPIAKCFLDENELNHIRERIDDPGLFDINQVVLYDQRRGMDEYYNDKKFQEKFRKILEIVYHDEETSIAYRPQRMKNDDTPTVYKYIPLSVEYSKRDNKFRLITWNNGKAKKLNFERIVDIREIIGSVDEERKIRINNMYMAQKADKQHHLIIIFGETNGIPYRILNEFSCYKKECVRTHDGLYKMILYYDSDDTKEIAIRLLGYGSLVRVIQDSENGTVLTELTKRIKNQYDIFHNREIIKNHEEEIGE